MLTEVFKKGDRVFHFIFGWGSVTGDPEKGVCDVVFEDRGSVTIPCKEKHLSFCEYDLVTGGLSHERAVELEVGKSYMAKTGNAMVINRVGNYGNYGFYFGDWSDKIPCITPGIWREATDEEVRSALEKETIRRYGENWQDVKIKEDIHPVSGSFLNENAYIPAIKDAAAGWIIVNKNGYLFYMGVWAEKLEEPEFKPFQKVLVRNKDYTPWRINLFDSYEGGDFPYKCLTSLWSQCIPYEGNEHLLGTTKSPEK